jgi:hypothetical protein
MKKAYSKPTLTKQQRLSAVAAATASMPVKK